MRVVDEYGNVACESCGNIQSPQFSSCTNCCNHESLSLNEVWHGNDEYGGWEIDAVCDCCGKDFFTRDELIRDYKLVRKC